MLKVAGGGGGTIGALSYQGTWNASTNTPTLVSSVGNQGNYYVVSVAGTTNLDGITDWQVGDWATFNGSIWQKIDNTDAVTSVNGQTGTVVLGVANIAGAVPNTVNVLAGGLLSGGGALTGNVTLSLTSVPVANVTGAVPNTVNVLAGGLLSGGGALTGNVTISLTNVPVENVTGAVPNTVNVLAGTGMSGGGALTGNVTLNLANTAVTAATYGNASTVAQVTIDAQGRITNAVNVAISIASGNVTGLGTMATQNANNVTITGGSLAANVVNLTSNTAASATFGTSSLPLVPQGYLYVNLNGTQVKVPYYAV